MLFLIVPVAFIIKQPDLGTGIILFTVGISMLICANLSLRIMRQLADCLLLASIPFWYGLICMNTKKKVVLIFLLNNDKTNAGYNAYQSQIAIGSGGKFGAGFKLGSQSQLGFLPENHTDFIFSSFAEEFGLFASI
jgi:rod shape determining protein RodA